MRKTRLSLISLVLLLSMTSTSFAVIIGDFEGGSMDGWELSWEGDSTLGISSIGATSGSGSLAVSAPRNKFSWTILKNMDPTLLGSEISNIISMDVTWVASEWRPQQGMWLNVDLLALNSNGASGWQQIKPIDPVSPDLVGTWDPSWGNHTRTLSFDFSDYDATGATWFQLILSMNSGNVTTSGKYYIDNIVIMEKSVPVVFADASLKAAVEAELGISNPTQTDMLGLTGNFNARESGIIDLSGLEYATNLTSLSLQDNQIADLGPLSDLNKLEGLFLQDNQIKDLSPLAGLTKLKTLSLRNNQIVDVSPLANIADLEVLHLYSNQIKDIGTLVSRRGSKIHLKSLYIQDNRIESVNVLSRFGNLEEISLSKNNIQDISPLAGLTKLTYLNLSTNQIDDINPLTHLVNLETLYLYSNQITDISSLANLTKLKMNATSLSLRENQIESIEALQGFTNLEKLYLWGNNIQDINPLGNLTKLTYLNLRNNQISVISPLTGLTKLTYLSLSTNQISDISPLTGLTKLTYLSLSTNQISDISPLIHLIDLTDLTIAYNQIRDIAALSKLTNLEELNSLDNLISDINPLVNLVSLTNLQIGKNLITDISPLTGLVNLDLLVIYRNQITDITPLSDMTKLRVLYAYENNIEDITPLNHSENLERVMLSDNNIRDISALVHCTGLGLLDLRNNPLNEDAHSVYIPQIQGQSPLDYPEYTDRFGKVIPPGMSYDAPSYASQFTQKSSVHAMARTTPLYPVISAPELSEDENGPSGPAVAASGTDQRFAFASARPQYLHTQARAKDSHLMPTEATASCSTNMVFTDNEKFRSVLGDQPELPLQLKLEYTLKIDAPDPKHWPEQINASANAFAIVTSFQQGTTLKGSMTYLDYYDWANPSINLYNMFEQTDESGLGSVVVPITISPNHTGGLVVKVSANVISSAMSWVEGRPADVSTTLRIAGLSFPDGQPADLDYTIDLLYSPDSFDYELYRHIGETLAQLMQEMAIAAMKAHSFLSGWMNAAVAIAELPALAAIPFAAAELGLDSVFDHYTDQLKDAAIDWFKNHDFSESNQPQDKSLQAFSFDDLSHKLEENNPIGFGDNDSSYYILASIDPPTINVPGLDKLEANLAYLLQKKVDLKSELVSVLKAMLLTLHRNSEAVNANESRWAMMQDMHFSMLTHRLYWILGEVVKADEEIVASLGEHDLGLDLIGPDDVDLYQQDLLLNGLSEEQEYTLSLFGLTAQDVNDQVMAVAHADMPEGFFPMSLSKLYAEYSLYKELHEILEPLIVNHYSPTPSGPVPIALWMFDESGGTTANDDTGYNHGVIHGATPAEGILNGALQFDGKDDYVECGNSPDLVPEAMTMSFWVYPDALKGFLIYKSESFWAKEYELSLSTSGIKVAIGGEGGFIDLRSNAKLREGEWSQVAFSYGEGMFSIYINGVLDASKPYDFTVEPRSGSLFIGCSKTSNWFRGKIDNLEIYDTAFSEDEILGLFEAGQ